MERFDVVVAGTGGMGAATALRLAERGVSVLGLDRFPRAHDRGNSHGQTRLIRLAHLALDGHTRHPLGSLPPSRPLPT